ncbi:MAG TPA: response regulator [Gemmatimonadales bacterium]|nr:response regulator [Gemmatimonadales bacterium]
MTPPTFLVVDDSKLHHQMYGLVFNKGELSGSRVIHAYNGREGFALYSTHPEIVMVFLDLNMPEMNGLEFLAKRRETGLRPETPIVLVTTEDSPDDEARGLAAGAWAYLRKPFTPAQLLALVAKAGAGNGAPGAR